MAGGFFVISGRSYAQVSTAGYVNYRNKTHAKSYWNAALLRVSSANLCGNLPGALVGVIVRKFCVTTTNYTMARRWKSRFWR